MLIDNRKVLQNIRIPATEAGPRRILTAENADEITAMFSQERIDSFVEQGVLAGDWKSSVKGETKTEEKKK